MGKWRVKPTEVKVCRYKPGMEHGWSVMWTTMFGEYEKVFDKKEDAEKWYAQIENDPDLVADDLVMEAIRPVIGEQFVDESKYIVRWPDGKMRVLTEQELLDRFEKVDE